MSSTTHIVGGVVNVAVRSAMETPIPRVRAGAASWALTDGAGRSCISRFRIAIQIIRHQQGTPEDSPSIC